MRVHYNKYLTKLARQLRNDPTQSEKRLWKKLKCGRFMNYDFHRQKPIDNYIVDFYCYQLMLVIELDGLSHHFEEVVAKDELKEKRLQDLGFHVLRFTDSKVMDDMINVIRCIENYIIEFEEKEEQKQNIA